MPSRTERITITVWRDLTTGNVGLSHPDYDARLEADTLRQAADIIDRCADLDRQPSTWMLRCDRCGTDYPAHEDLRGGGTAARREGRRRAAAEGWTSDDQADTDLCPACSR